MLSKSDLIYPEFFKFDHLGRPLFPGYEYKNGKSTYRGYVIGEGGRVFGKPGMYWNVSLLDIASMHPSSIIAEKLFGDVYTKRYEEIRDARVLIKHKEWVKAREILDGALKSVLEGIESKSEAEQDAFAESLSYAMKIIINMVYGMTAAHFPNPFRDPRNVDNIVAKRGALFMTNLQFEVEGRGAEVVHIKTDSIKVPNASDELIEFIMEYGKAYGYTFELESTYDRMCLVNNSTYIAYGKSGKHAGEWISVGDQFADPFVKKNLFTKEPIEFKDLCRTNTVSTNMYLDMNEGHEDEHHYVFVGRAGSFCPIKPGYGGGVLLREKDGKITDAVNGSIGTRWLESEMVKNMKLEDAINTDFYMKDVEQAIADISKYGDFERFRNIDQ